MNTPTPQELPEPSEKDIILFEMLCTKLGNVFGMSKKETQQYRTLCDVWVVLTNAKDRKERLTKNQLLFLAAKEKSKLIRSIKNVGFPKRR
jgi:hypothetical protein